jgi:hypothetical protein
MKEGEFEPLVSPLLDTGAYRTAFLSDGFRLCAERVDHLHITHVPVFLEVFRQKVAAVTDLSGGDDQSVPPGQLVPILNALRFLNNTGVHRYGAPGEKQTHVFARTLWVHARLEFVCDRYVELIQDLKAQSPCLFVLQTGHPRHGLLLLCGF